ncbi:DUF1573 domain-containing protein [Chitinophaga rhizophila]|uniref:DUF1573 domain-containing protein n=1 Tax=Chitinophaga rhizophila TaxID=2866212 RepID=A0ABS7G846_9BACT|nr:DUF1573 domain-containing protein [Chitinophaga rhizophila]MBW8683566.1 DUF1573 domain-containing protein [Chitinophaga rhizophila]
MRYILICLIFTIIFSCRQQPIQYASGRIEDVFEQARKENKKVFVLITDTSCGICNAFAKKLDSINETKKILNQDYICYKANITDTAMTDIAQIVKCPSFPFPYFFDKDANLLAFGFPNNKNFLIDDLSKIGISEYTFREMFRLPITTLDYKKLVSLNMKAYLMMKEGHHDSAYQLVKASSEIAVYPYNIYLANQLSAVGTKESNAWIRQLQKPQFTPSDEVIYDNLIDNIAFSENQNELPETGSDSVSYTFVETKHECGIINQGANYTFAFKFLNTGKKDVVITKAEHSCPCIELKWPDQPVKPGETGYIRGILHAEQLGRFSREIYVHTISSKVPMRIVVLNGQVI